VGPANVEREGLDASALRTLAAELAALLAPGDVVVLAGELVGRARHLLLDA
jgi:tRNA A37 threonylcarbamoyladenosine biosynthesis protein TsaE